MGFFLWVKGNLVAPLFNISCTFNECNKITKCKITNMIHVAKTLCFLHLCIKDLNSFDCAPRAPIDIIYPVYVREDTHKKSDFLMIRPLRSVYPSLKP